MYGQPPQDPGAVQPPVPGGAGAPPVSAQPNLAQPVSAQPNVAQQVSGQPISGQPVTPQSSPPFGPSVPPYSAPRDQEDDDPLDMGSSWQPRISPSPPRRGRGVVFLIGLLVGAVLFGSGGFGVGYLVMPERSKGGDFPKPTDPAPTRSSGLAPYEASQLALNKAKFSGDLAALAEPWMSHMGGCQTNSDSRGPKAAANEQVRVFCKYGTVNLYFVQYKSPADRDAARTSRQRQNIDAQVFTPGVGRPELQKTGASKKNSGDYIEFSYKPVGNAEGGIVSGIWWSRENTTATAYFEVLWSDGLGSKWEPARDLWQRFS